jgi:heme A synthase
MTAHDWGHVVALLVTVVVAVAGYWVIYGWRWALVVAVILTGVVVVAGVLSWVMAKRRQQR